MATDFYLEKGFTPQTRYTEFDASTTLSIWTPTTSTRVVLTGLTITNNAAAGTFLITFGNLNGSRIAEYTVGASATLAPIIQAIECTMYDRSIFGRPSSSPTNGWRVTAFGFELP